MTRELSVGRILKRDWLTFGMVVTLVVWWLMVMGAGLLAALSIVERSQDNEVFVVLFVVSTLVVTVACGLITVRRVRLLRRVFATGVRVEGEVVHIDQNSEDVGRAVIVYRHDGQEHQVTNVTEGAPNRGGLKVGDMVELVVDPHKPSRSFIVRLYS